MDERDNKPAEPVGVEYCNAVAELARALVAMAVAAGTLGVALTRDGDAMALLEKMRAAIKASQNGPGDA